MLNIIRSDFKIDTTTIYAGSVFNCTRIVQVYKDGLQVLNGSQMTQEIKLNEILHEYILSPKLDETTITPKDEMTSSKY